VFGVPVESKALKGLDSLLSIAQMPGGIPVGTLAVGKAGAINAALLAAASLGNKYPAIREALRKFRSDQTRQGSRGSRSRQVRGEFPPQKRKGQVTIGILGGGQLGYMLALAGYPLDFHFRFLDPSPQAPVGRIAPRVTAEYTDYEALDKFAHGLALVTYEFENVPVEAARHLATHVPVFPPPQALEAAQDRLNEKALFQRLGIPTTEFAAVNSPAELDAAIGKLGLPGVLKTRRLGYDGKGQWVLRRPADVAELKKEFPSAPLILENFVNFSRELSLLAVRGRGGETAFYPLVENHHRGGILRLSLAPAPQLSDSLQREAENQARQILEALDYVGVLAVELFESGGRLLANEMAPRVHNSGHWSIEGAVASQFENHLRAVAGLPLGETRTLGPLRHAQSDWRSAGTRRAAGGFRCSPAFVWKIAAPGPQGRPRDRAGGLRPGTLGSPEAASGVLPARGILHAPSRFRCR
jgi:5-(carboxyamino)imidazole ribonucleotide synthase